MLSEQNRQKLDGIVSQMVANGEKDEDIQFVVNDFKGKYSESDPTKTSNDVVDQIKPEKSFIDKTKSFFEGIGNVTENTIDAFTTKQGLSDIWKVTKGAGIPSVTNVLSNANEIFWGGAQKGLENLGLETLSGYAKQDKERSKKDAKKASDEIRSFFYGNGSDVQGFLDPTDTRSFVEKITAEDGEKEVAKIVGSQIPTFLSLMGVTFLAKGTNIPALPATLSASFAMNSGDAYQQGKDYLESTGQEMTPEMEAKLQRTAVLVGASTAPLDAFGMDRILTPSKFLNFKNKLIGTAINGVLDTGVDTVVEGGTEALQEVIQNAWAKTYNENQDLFEGSLEAMFGGALFGGGSSALINSSGLLRTGVLERMKKGEDKDKIIADVKEGAKQAGTTITDAEINDAVNDAQKVYDSVVEDITSKLQDGKSVNEVALEVTNAPIDQAVEFVTRVKESTTVEDTTKELGDIAKKADKQTLTKTSQDLQSDFESTQARIEENVSNLRNEVENLKNKVAEAKDKSTEKRRLKIELENKRTELRDKENSFYTEVENNAKAFREDVVNSIVEQGISKDVAENVATQIADFVTNEQNIGDTRTVADLIKEFTANSSNADVKVEKKKTVKKQPVSKTLPKASKKEVKKTSKKDKENIKKTSKKVDIKVGDTFNTNGVTNMKGKVTVTQIEGRTVKFKDEDGVEYQGLESKVVKDFIKEGAWTNAIDTNSKEVDNKNNENDTTSRDNIDTGKTPTPASDSGDKQGGVGETTDTTGQGTGGQEQPRTDSDNTGERPSTRLEDVISVSDTGEVTITGEITDAILEEANSFKTGGTTKKGRGILDEYYTNSRIVDVVKSLVPIETAKNVLEPSVGTGNFIYGFPESAKVTAFEINKTTAGIAKVFHPNATIFNRSFETEFIDERGNAKPVKEVYDLVIGNPPYGEHRGEFLGLGEEKNIKKYEEYFVKRSLDVVKDGGKVAFVIPSSFLKTTSDKSKELIAELGEIETAFRLPEGSFEGTQVGTDIVIFKKNKTTSRFEKGKRVASFSDDTYFTENSENILGEVTERKNRFGKMETFVKGDLEDAITRFYSVRNVDKAQKILEEENIEPTEENLESVESAIEEAGDNAKKIVEEQEKQRKKGKETIEKKIVKESTKSDKTMLLSTQFSEYTEEELSIWKEVQADGTFNKDKVEQYKDKLNYFAGKYYTDFYYAQGDIYEKLDDLERSKKIVGNAYERQKKLLESVLPKRESLDEAKISPNLSFVKEFKFEEERTLKSDFLKFISTLPYEAFGGSNRWEVDAYTNNESVRGNDKQFNDKVRERRKIAGDNLFSKFLKEGLSKEEQEQVEDKYNKVHNFYHTPDYTKVPMFSEVYSTFRGVPFSVRPVQKAGIGRLVANGVGLLAHDVGFGKTISGVLAVTETMTRGWAKKPIIIAPNENVYQQWISTITDLVPNAKLNLLGNLGASYKGDLSSLSIPDGSITLVTYEGFTRMSFSDDTYEKLSGKFNYIADDLKAHKTERDKQKGIAKAMEAKGRMKRGTRADVFFEKLGFDHITFDEVHNANHIVSKVKLEKNQASEYNRFTLRSSDLGIKTWIASQYIQEKMNGRNVNLLSATPFTNHPLEYYSIFSLIADKSLAKMGFNNVNDFFGTFMEAENEYEFKADGTYQRKTDIRGFKNFRLFRKLRDAYIDFKDGEQSGIIRPTRVQQNYEIPQNSLGLDMEIQAQAIFKENDKEKGAKVLRAITELRKIALSPYASQFAPQPKDYIEFVENSPKIKVLMGLIEQNKKDKDAGQIVYVDQVGVSLLPLMKEYMVKKLGYKDNEVMIISGATAKAKRVDIQDAYNKGEVKIIIGSEAIKEGMNLQQNTSDLYILSLPWNFTQLRQVIGRGWRQGNKWQNIRINNLFIQDSIDVFLSQKLENKQKRYEASIKSDANEVDIGDISFDEMKFDLVRDPKTRAKLEIQAEKERIQQQITQEKAEISFATRKLERVNKIKDNIKSTKDSIAFEEKREAEAKKDGKEFSTYWLDRYTKELGEANTELKEELAKLKERGVDTDILLSMREKGEEKILKLEEEVKALIENEDKRAKEIEASLPARKDFSQEVVDAFVSERAEQNKTFYVEREKEKTEVIKANVEVKEIKNASNTKVLKTKKTVKAVRSTGDPMLDIIFDKKMSVDEKISKLLDKKQENKEFKDAGKRVVGSKKETAVIKLVQRYGDEALIDALYELYGTDEIASLFKKDDILADTKKPSLEDDKNNGVPAYIAIAKQNILNTINHTPKLDIKKSRSYYSSSYPFQLELKGVSYSWSKDYEAKIIRIYPKIMQGFVERLSGAKTLDELRTVVSSFYVKEDGTFISNNGNKKKEYGWESEEQDNIRISPVIFGNIVSKYDEAKNNERIIEKYTVAKKLLTEGVQEQQFTSGISYRAVYNKYADTSFYDTVKEAEEKQDSIRTEALQFIEEVMAKFNNYSVAEKKKGKREDTELTHGNFLPLEHIERSGEVIKDEKINPETLQSEYGFSSVQFGNYMDDETSRENIRHTIGSLVDMEQVLDINIPAIISEKGLSIAYGARGGGGALAHYEPTRTIINLTKKKGDGSFFHEFVHFMDDKLGGRYRGKWSSKKTRYYIGDYVDEMALQLMDSLTGRQDIKLKEFTPSDDFSPQELKYSDKTVFDLVIKDYQAGMSFDDVVKKYDGRVKNGDSYARYFPQMIANIYRKPVSMEIKVWGEETEFYKGSKTYGGEYWSRPEELLARAGQAYIEDKMLEKGIKNNYLTRSTIDEEGGSISKVYPQGLERQRFNERFDKLFDELRKKYPREKAMRKERPLVQMYKFDTPYSKEDAISYLEGVKKRLKIDFDTYFVDSILTDFALDPLKKTRSKQYSEGIFLDNTIAIMNDMAQYTAEHETVHLTLANMDKIGAFKKAGITKEKVMREMANKMGIVYNKNTTQKELNNIEEQIAYSFEKYVHDKAFGKGQEPTGVIKQFFEILKRLLENFARAIGATKGDIILDYYDILSEGKSKEKEIVRIENRGIVEAFIENGELDVFTYENNLYKVKKMSDEDVNKILDRIRNADLKGQYAVLNELTPMEFSAFTANPLSFEVMNLMPQAVEDFWVGVLDTPKFKLREQMDLRFQKLEKQYNELVDKKDTLVSDTKKWKKDLDVSLIEKSKLAKVVDTTSEDVKTLSRFTNRTKKPVGELTDRGLEVAETLNFENVEEAKIELSNYLKRKTDLVTTINELRILRRKIQEAQKQGKEAGRSLRDVERRLKLRRRLLEQKEYYVNMGISRGEKEALRMIRNRGVAVRNAQDFFALSDKRSKDIIGNRKIHLMSEYEFDNFLVEYTAKAEEMRNKLDARDEVRALITTQQFSKYENLQKAMGLPSVDKMTEAEANRFVEALSQYQFGDTFLTARQLETVHRTNWGDIKTERELIEKLQENIGVGSQELRTLTAPDYSTSGKFTSWIRLARMHPFYNWLVGKRVEATIQAEREYHEIEMTINELTRKARSSRTRDIVGNVVESIVPTDEVVFSYMEAENKKAFAKTYKMTEEELALADYLTTQYHNAYQYLQSEYGMKGRENYITHVRRSFVEALKEEGITQAFKEILTSQKEEEASFKILDSQTGETIAFEKFFGYAMKRTGGLVPTKNIARATLAYFKALAVKRAMDKFIPEALIAVQAHKAVVGTTEKGLSKDPTLERFIKEYLNDAKGRKIEFVTKQGSRMDILIRAFSKWITIKYLGLNVATSIASFIGDFTSVFWELSLVETGRGLKRTVLEPKTSYDINEEFKFFTGRNPIAEVFDPKHNLPSKVLNGIMALMGLAPFFSNRFFLRAKMTDEEFRTGVIEDARLKEIALSLSRVKPNHFYIKSLAGNTTVGSANFQFGSWAVAIFNTFSSDLVEFGKTFKKDKAEALTSLEAQKLLKFTVMAYIAYAVSMWALSDDDEDDSFLAQVKRKAMRELTTLIQALQFITDPTNYFIALREISLYHDFISQLISGEEYQRDGKGYGIGDAKWTNTGARIITPSAIKQFFPKEQVSTKRDLIEEAIKSGEFDAEKVAQKITGDDWATMDSEKRERKINDVTLLYTVRKKYPENQIVDIIIGENKNTDRVSKVVQYAQKVGKEKALEEIKTLFRDKELFANKKTRTGHLISNQLYKDFQIALKKLN